MKQNSGKNTPKLPQLKSPLVILSGLGIIACVLSSYVFHQDKPSKTAPEPAPMTLKVQLVTENLEGPTDLTFPGNGDIWVTEQAGRIRVIKNGKLEETPLLDLKGKIMKINRGYEERGLLGVTLHPQFATNKKFYVFYSAPPTIKSDHKEVVAEYQLGANNTVDPNSGRIILTLDDFEGNHNGGCLKFGTDGYLYVSFGDGGGQHDKHGPIGNGQNLSNWFGKILRIDINTESGYLVPKDNPFVDKPDARPEIWAYGFRNPYRFTFDRATRQMFAGEVGQDLWEEVDIVTKGANYGWRVVEGTHCHNPETGCDVKGLTMPITEYSHREGISVIGGFVYNGKQITTLKSKYLFADWTGPVFYLKKTGANWLRGKVTFANIPPNLKITGFGEDIAGELYMMTNPDTGPGNTKGAVYKIVKN